MEATLSERVFVILLIRDDLEGERDLCISPSPWMQARQSVMVSLWCGQELQRLTQQVCDALRPSCFDVICPFQPVQLLWLTAVLVCCCCCSAYMAQWLDCDAVIPVIKDGLGGDGVCVLSFLVSPRWSLSLPLLCSCCLGLQTCKVPLIGFLTHTYVFRQEFAVAMQSGMDASTLVHFRTTSWKGSSTYRIQVFQVEIP